MDVKRRMDLIRRNLEVEGYTIAAKECIGIIEAAFRLLFREQVMKLEEGDRIRVHKAEMNLGKGEKGFERFTLGQLIGVYRESKFLDAWSKASGRDVSGLRMINLDELNRLRNDLIHNGREASRTEAEFLLKAVEMILETFGLANRVDSIKNRLSRPQDRGKIVPFEKPRQLSRRRLERIDVDGQMGIRFGPTEILEVPEKAELPRHQARVFEEDTCLVLSADPKIPDIDEDISRLRARLEDHQPYEPGSVVVGGRNPLRIFAIVHDLDQEPSWREEWVESALRRLFHETEKRRVRSVALPMIGTRHGSLPAQRFVGLLGRCLRSASLAYLGMLWILLPERCDFKVLDELLAELERET